MPVVCRGPMECYSLFDSPIGVLGILWTDRGISGIQLPEKDSETTAARLRSRATPGRPPESVKTAIAMLVRHLTGEPQSFEGLKLDWGKQPAFHLAVYEKAREVQPGETTSYGLLARQLGKPGAARAVGQAMARNPFPIVVPCHRVLACGGRPGGFSAFGATDAKARLLALEGVQLALTPAR